MLLPGTPGQILVTYHAEPGTPSHERLQLLAHLARHIEPPRTRDAEETPREVPYGH